MVPVRCLVQGPQLVTMTSWMSGSLSEPLQTRFLSSGHVRPVTDMHGGVWTDSPRAKRERYPRRRYLPCFHFHFSFVCLLHLTFLIVSMLCKN